jgi:hypothetical protein
MTRLTLGFVQPDTIFCNNSVLEKGVFGELKVGLLLVRVNLPNTMSGFYVPMCQSERRQQMQWPTLSLAAAKRRYARITRTYDLGVGRKKITRTIF